MSGPEENGRETGIEKGIRALDILKEKYRQLPKREKAFVKYGGLAVALIIGWFAVVEPVYLDYMEAREAIPGVADRIARYKAVVEATDENKKVKEKYQNRYNELLGKCLEGETSEIAAGKLTEIAASQARKQNLAISSTRTEKARRLKHFEKISVRISFNATLDELAEFMRGLATHPREVVIQEAKVTSHNRPANQPEMLSVELLVAGLRHIP